MLRRLNRMAGVLLLLSVLLYSCGPVIKVSRLSDQSLRPKSTNAPIKVYMSMKPRCNYQEIAIVSASEGAFSGGLETFVEAMKKKARLLGGDAILLGQVSSQLSGVVPVGDVMVAANESSQVAIVVHFTDENCKE